MSAKSKFAWDWAREKSRRGQRVVTIMNSGIDHIEMQRDDEDGIWKCFNDYVGGEMMTMGLTAQDLEWITERKMR
jgi:hypothetical protein